MEAAPVCDLPVAAIPPVRQAYTIQPSTPGILIPPVRQSWLGPVARPGPRQRWFKVGFTEPKSATSFPAAPFYLRDFLPTTREHLRARAALRVERSDDAAAPAPKRRRSNPRPVDAATYPCGGRDPGCVRAFTTRSGRANHHRYCEAGRAAAAAAAAARALARDADDGDGSAPASKRATRARAAARAAETDDEDDSDDVCACCGGPTVTPAGEATTDVLECENRACRAECHLGCVGLDAVPSGDWWCPACVPRPEHECVLCGASGSQDEATTMLLCNECNGGVHLGCTRLVAMPGGDDPFTCALCAQRATRRGPSAPPKPRAVRRRRRRASAQHDEDRAPADNGPPIAQADWPFVIATTPPLDSIAIEAVLAEWQAQLPRHATKGQRAGYPEPKILYNWNATSGRARGWFPATVTLAHGAEKHFNFEIDLSRRPAECAIPAASVSFVDAPGVRRDAQLIAAEYGTKWVWIRDARLPRGDAWLASEAVDLGDHAAVAAAVKRCAGERHESATLNLGLVMRGGVGGGVAADTYRWPFLLKMLLRYFARWAPGALCSSVYVSFADAGRGDARTKDDHVDADNVAPSRLMAFGNFVGGGLRVPGRQAEPFDVRQTANLARNGGPFFTFEASREIHGVEPFTGHRISVSFYSVKETRLLTMSGRKCLTRLGFRLAPLPPPPRRPKATVTPGKQPRPRGFKPGAVTPQKLRTSHAAPRSTRRLRPRLLLPPPALSEQS